MRRVDRPPRICSSSWVAVHKEHIRGGEQAEQAEKADEKVGRRHQSQIVPKAKTIRTNYSGEKSTYVVVFAVRDNLPPFAFVLAGLHGNISYTITDTETAYCNNFFFVTVLYHHLLGRFRSC